MIDKTHDMTTLRVPGMSCDHCKQSVTEALKKVPGVGRVEVDLKKKEVTVAHESRVSRATMVEAIQAAGFEIG